MTSSRGKRSNAHIRRTSKDFRCNIVGRHILSHRWNPHMSFIVPFQHLGASRIILLGLSSSFLPRAPVSSHSNTRRQSYPIPLSQLDQNIASTTYRVAKTRAVFARYTNTPLPNSSTTLLHINSAQSLLLYFQSSY